MKEEHLPSPIGRPVHSRSLLETATQLRETETVIWMSTRRSERLMLMNTLPHAGFPAHSRLAHRPGKARAHQLTQVCQSEGDRTQLFDRATELSLMRVPQCATVHTHTFISLFSASHTKDITCTFSQGEHMYDGVCATTCTSCHASRCICHVHHSDGSGQFGFVA